MLAAAFVAPALYQPLRQRGWWRYELRLFAAAALVVPALYEPRATAVVLWMAAVIGGFGSWLLIRLRLEPSDACRRLVFSFALGLGAFAWPLVALGLAGWLHPSALILLLAAGTVFVWLERRRLWAMVRTLDGTWTSSPQLAGPFLGLVIPSAAFLLACTLAVALAPSIAFDPLKFHLPLASHYAVTGEMTPLPTDHYGYNPQNFELLLALGWSLGGQAAAQLVTPVFFGLFLAALWSVGRAAGAGRAAVAAGCALAAAVPFLHWTASQVKHDVIVAFLHLAALLAWFEWRRGGNLRWLFAGMFFGAVSMDFKLPAALGLLGLSPLYLWAAWKERRRWHVLAGYAAVAALLGSFWLLRSWWLSGDPWHYADPRGPLRSAWATGSADPSRWLIRKVLVPWRIHFDGVRFFHSPTDYPMGVVLILFSPFWLLWKRVGAGVERRACLVFAGTTIGVSTFYLPLLRFLIAPVAILLVLTVVRAEGWFAQAGLFGRTSLRLATGWCVLASLLTVAFLEINAPQLRYFAGSIGKSEYLRQALLTYRSLEALHGVAGAEDTVFGVQNCSRLYAPFPERFYCEYYNPESPAERLALGRALQKLNPRYLVLPAASKRPEVLQEITAGARRQPLYQGPHYWVFSLEWGRPE